MIFTICMSGLVEMRLATGDAKVSGASDSDDGKPVFETLTDAQDAAKVLNERAAQERGWKRFSKSHRWIVLGVDSTWEYGTAPFEKHNCEFKTARQLKRSSRLIELEQGLFEEPITQQ